MKEPKKNFDEFLEILGRRSWSRQSLIRVNLELKPLFSRVVGLQPFFNNTKISRHSYERVLGKVVVVR